MRTTGKGIMEVSEAILMGLGAAVVAAAGSLGTAVVTLWKQLGSAHQEILDCRSCVTDCKVQLASMRSRLEKHESDLQETHRTMLESLGSVFISATLADGKIIHASPSVRNLLGWDPEQLYGQLIDVLIAEEFVDRHHESVAHAIASGNLRAPELAISGFARHHSGARIPVIVSLRNTSSDPRVVEAQITYRRT